MVVSLKSRISDQIKMNVIIACMERTHETASGTSTLEHPVNWEQGVQCPLLHFLSDSDHQIKADSNEKVGSFTNIVLLMLIKRECQELEFKFFYD